MVAEERGTAAVSIMGAAGCPAAKEGMASALATKSITAFSGVMLASSPLELEFTFGSEPGTGPEFHIHGAFILESAFMVHAMREAGMVGRLTMSLIAAVAAGLVALGFGYLFCRWHGLGGEATSNVMLLYGLAAVAMMLLFLLGQVLGIRGHAYYIIIGGALFLGVDVLVWLDLGIMPHVRFGRGGFVPAGVMGVFLGPVFRVIAPAPPPVIDRHR
jgi:hypothetical protein